MDLSIIIPLFNEQESVKELTDWIIKTVKKREFHYEILLIDDGSNDNSWEIGRAHV